jgi:hypothetical protein
MSQRRSLLLVLTTVTALALSVVAPGAAVTPYAKRHLIRHVHSGRPLLLSRRDQGSHRWANPHQVL